jgi:hypothetical protein
MQVVASRLVAQLIILAYPLQATRYLSPNGYKQKNISSSSLNVRHHRPLHPLCFVDSRMQQSTNYMCMTY